MHHAGVESELLLPGGATVPESFVHAQALAVPCQPSGMGTLHAQCMTYIFHEKKTCKKYLNSLP